MEQPFQEVRFESTVYPSYCDELWKGISYGAPGQWDRLLKAVKRRFGWR